MKKIKLSLLAIAVIALVVSAITVTAFASAPVSENTVLTLDGVEYETAPEQIADGASVVIYKPVSMLPYNENASYEVARGSSVAFYAKNEETISYYDVGENHANLANALAYSGENVVVRLLSDIYVKDYSIDENGYQNATTRSCLVLGKNASSAIYLDLNGYKLSYESTYTPGGSTTSAYAFMFKASANKDSYIVSSREGGELNYFSKAYNSDAISSSFLFEGVPAGARIHFGAAELDGEKIDGDNLSVYACGFFGIGTNTADVKLSVDGGYYYADPTWGKAMITYDYYGAGSDFSFKNAKLYTSSGLYVGTWSKASSGASYNFENCLFYSPRVPAKFALNNDEKISFKGCYFVASQVTVVHASNAEDTVTTEASFDRCYTVANVTAPTKYSMTPVDTVSLDFGNSVPSLSKGANGEIEVSKSSVGAIDFAQWIGDYPISQHNITFTSDFVYNFYVPKLFEVTTITVDGEELSYVGEKTVGGYLSYVFSISVPAKYAARPMTIVYGGKTYETSIINYADQALETFKDDLKLTNALYAAKDYAKAAASYFKVSGLDYEYSKPATSIIGSPSPAPNAEILKVFRGATISLDGELKFKFFIQANANIADIEIAKISYLYNDKIVTEDISSLIVTEEDGTAYVPVKVKAKDLLTPITISVGDSSYSYSLLNYTYSMNQSYTGQKREALLNLLSYLYAYAEAAYETTTTPDLITIDGNGISKYTIYTSSENYELASLIQSAIKKESGKTLIITNVPTSRRIEILVDSSYFSTESDFTVSVENGNLVIKTWVKSFAKEAISSFISDYLNKVEAGYDFDGDFSASYNTDKIYYSDFGAAGNLDINALLADVEANPKTNANFSHLSDEDAIRQTHEAANLTKRHTVCADEGAVYYLPYLETTIDIKTDCDFGNAEFYIDDRFITAQKTPGYNVNVFTIRNDYDIVTYTEANDPLGIIAAINARGGIKTTDTSLPIELGYDAMLIPYNKDKKMYKRDGVGAGSDQHELIVIDENGKIDNDTKTLYDFDKVTKIEIVRIDTAPTTLLGGKFTTVASRAYEGFNGNTVIDIGIYRGIRIERPNVTMDALEHYVINQPIADIDGEEKSGESYLSGKSIMYAGEGPRYVYGFIEPRKTHNFHMKDSVLTARAHYATGGSYDIGGELSNKLVFTNCTQSNMFDENGVIYDENNCYWGIMGTNYCKNIEYYDCVLNRLDAHAGVYNFKVIGGEIGWIKVNGGGTGTIENVIIHSRSVFGLRSDYGSSWRGEISVKNVLLNCAYFAETRAVDDTTDSYYYLTSFTCVDGDFGFETQVPNITVENLSYVVYSHTKLIGYPIYNEQNQLVGYEKDENGEYLVNKDDTKERTVTACYVIVVAASNGIDNGFKVDGKFNVDENGVIVGKNNKIHPASNITITYNYGPLEDLGTYESAGGASLKAQAVVFKRLGYGTGETTTSDLLVKENGFVEIKNYESRIEDFKYTQSSNGAFNVTGLNNTNVTSAIIPEFVASIAYNAFKGNTKLNSIVIPKSVTSIGNSAFMGCDFLKTVYYGGTAEDWSKINIALNNSVLNNVTFYYYSETAPSISGNFWHFVDGVPTVWSSHSCYGSEAVRENVILPTCTANGSYDVVIYCSVCGDELSRRTVSVAKIDHTPENAVIENEILASCTTDGSYDTVIYCSVCGDELSRETVIVTAPGHTAEKRIENHVAPTCVSNGTYDEVSYCVVCNAEISRIIKVSETALGHTEGELTIENVVDACCYKQGSYDEVVYCSTCGEELSRVTKYTDMIAHTSAPLVVENEILPTCTKNGSHDEVIYCSVSECKVEISRVTVIDTALGHTESDAVIENNVLPTCTENGSYDEVVYCSVCKEELSRNTVTVDELGHSPEEAVKENEVAPTCTAKGSYDEVVYCSVCKEELSRKTVTLDELGHSPKEAVKENEVAPTCTAKGSYDEVVYCSVCDGEVSRNTVTVDALGHTPKAPVKENEVAPTCTAKGSYDEVVYCSVCKEELSRNTVIVDEAPHTEGNTVVENLVESSCTALGGYDNVIYCTECNIEISRVHVSTDLKEHTHGDVVIENQKDATCAHFGRHDEVVYCTECDAELSRETVVGNALGDHNYVYDSCEHCGHNKFENDTPFDSWI